MWDVYDMTADVAVPLATPAPNASAVASLKPSGIETVDVRLRGLHAFELVGVISHRPDICRGSSRCSPIRLQVVQSLTTLHLCPQVETELLRLGGNKQDPYLKLTLPGKAAPTSRTKTVSTDSRLLI
jgi:hypothetical protein